MKKPYFFTKYFKVKTRNYSQDEIEYYLEILPLFKKSAFLYELSKRTDQPGKSKERDIDNTDYFNNSTFFN